MRAALRFLPLVSFACGSGPPAGRVERISPAGDAFSFGEAVVVDIGDRENFRHRYRFRASRGEPIWISAEAGGVMLEIDVAHGGERPHWKKGPKTQLRERFVPSDDGAHDLVVRGEGYTFGNSYRLVVGRAGNVM